MGSGIYVSDTKANVVRVVDTANSQETVVAGNGSWGFSGDGGPAIKAQLNYPQGVAVDSKGDLFFSDGSNSRVREVTPDGMIKTVAGGGPLGGDGGQATSAGLRLPMGLAVDVHDNLYIADNQENVIRKVDMSTGIIQRFAGSYNGGFTGDGGPATGAELWLPTDVAFDAAGDLLIADGNNGRVRKLDASTGFISTIAGNTADRRTGQHL